MQLSDRFDIVVNCCGLNAVDLCQDKLMYPIMGHIVKVRELYIDPKRISLHVILCTDKITLNNLSAFFYLDFFQH